jgi:RHS repeat-associated protein
MFSGHDRVIVMLRLLALILLLFSCSVAAGADPLITDAAHPIMGTLGLELRTSVSSPLIGVSGDFDDLTWNTVSGGVETRNYTYNSMNQLKTISGSETSTFDYDYFGNLTRRTKDGAITDFAYDILNRQKSMTLNVGTQNAEQTLYSYYGPTWMRKTMQVGTGPATSYLHDGFACVSQTTAGVKTNYFVPGTSPLWETTNNQTVTYAQDGRGNITGLWNGNNYAAKFNYDAFGNVKTTDANNNPLANTSGPRYGGQFHDANTDQIYLRNRYYDPKIGAFNRIDPISFNGGLNLYGYCGGDAVNASDPMGTYWKFKLGRGGKRKSMTWTWVDDGDPKPEGDPSEVAQTAAFDAMSASLKDDDSLDFATWDFLPIITTDALSRNSVLFDNKFLSVPFPFAYRRENGKIYAQATPGSMANGGYNFDGAVEAGVGDYVLLYMESAARKQESGDLFGLFGVGNSLIFENAVGFNPTDVAAMNGIIQWMRETDAGKIAAEKLGLYTAIAGGGYLLAKKFKVDKVLAAKLNPFLKIAQEKIASLIAGAAKVKLLGGAARAAKWGANWSRASLGKAIERFAGPNATTWLTKTGKRIYENPATGVQVVEDVEGKYFRIWKPDSLGGKNGDYVGMLGQIPAPARRVKGGAIKNVPLQGEYLEAATHFLIDD